MKRETVTAIIDVDDTQTATIVTIRHPKHKGMWMKIRIEGGGNLVHRAINAVYKNGEGDADAFFTAHGMGDNEAFNGDTWTK